jgi:hypothetical protein
MLFPTHRFSVVTTSSIFASTSLHSRPASRIFASTTVGHIFLTPFPLSHGALRSGRARKRHSFRNVNDGCIKYYVNQKNATLRPGIPQSSISFLKYTKHDEDSNFSRRTLRNACAGASGLRAPIMRRCTTPITRNCSLELTTAQELCLAQGKFYGCKPNDLVCLCTKEQAQVNAYVANVKPCLESADRKRYCTEGAYTRE